MWTAKPWKWNMFAYIREKNNSRDVKNIRTVMYNLMKKSRMNARFLWFNKRWCEKLARLLTIEDARGKIRHNR